VEPLTCERCGGPNPADAANCQWCGADLPLPPTSPTVVVQNLPPVGTSSAPGATRGGSQAPARLIVGVVLALIFIIFVIALATQAPTVPQSPLVPSPPGFPVTVGIIYLTSPDDACGLNGTTEPGFSGVSGQFSGETWQISAPPGGCTIVSLTALTPGFNVFPPNFGSPMNFTGGQTTAISVSFQLPSGGYDGDLTIEVD
jgi:hypothetical protein